MALRDTAIVGYAETTIVEKSDRDVWEGPSNHDDGDSRTMLSITST